MEEQIEDLKLKVEKLSEEAEFNFQKGDHYKPRVTEYLKQIDEMLGDENSNIPKKFRVELYYLKGKASDILPEYSKQAEEALTKAMKLNPHHVDSLITLGHILWKKHDFQAARQCFETALEREQNNLRALQYLSIVLRQVGEAKEKPVNYSRSVEIAKKALMLDLNNGYSWYLMGNAYISNYFTNPRRDNKELTLAVQAYNQAEKHSQVANPDLFFNRGNIHSYREDYQLAFKDYYEAHKLDNTLTKNTVQEVEQKILSAFDLVQNKCRISAKKLQNIVKQIPLGLKTQPKGQDKKWVMCPLNELQQGVNEDKILACKSLVSYTSAQMVPAGFVIVDVNMTFATLSIYHNSQEIYEKIRENCDIMIFEPFLKKIECEVNQQVFIRGYKKISYLCIQVTDVNKLLVENEKIMQTAVPSMVVNQTFEK